MVEIIKQFFGGSASAIEGFVASVGVMGILSIVISIFYNTYKGKKTKKEIESVKTENQEIINKFVEEYKKELQAVKDNLVKDLDKISNMILLEATKDGVDTETFFKLVDLYKKVVKEEILDTETLEAEKVEQQEQAKTTQESVNENLKNIDALNDLV